MCIRDRVDTLIPSNASPPPADQSALADAVHRCATDDSTKTLAIKSRYNSGKTHFLRELITKQDYRRVLFVTYRQSLARDIQRSFRSLGFKNYLDAYDQPGVWHSPRLIAQTDRLTEVMKKHDE